MKTMFIVLAASNAGAWALIIGLLLVAGVIGYLTAWYYAKSVYVPVIKALEADKASLQKQVAMLNEDLNKLNLKADALAERVGKLENELTMKNNEILKLKAPQKMN